MSFLGGLAGGAIGGAVVNLYLDDKNFKTGLATAEGQTKGATTSMGGSFSKFGAVASASIAAVAVAAVAGAAKAIQAASDQEEALNKARVVFGSASAEIERFGDTAATQLGLSETAALSAAGTFGNFFTAAGLASDQITDLSKGVVTLASDLASFNNIGTEEALEKLRAGLAGEAEPLRTVGVFLSEARVQAEAYKSGIAEVGEELTDAEKIQTRYNLIMQDTALAQGDFLRTSDSLANQQRILQAEVENLAAEMGQALLPAVTSLVGVFTDLTPILSALAPILKALIGYVDELFLAFVAYKGLTNLPGLLLSLGNSMRAIGLEAVGARVGGAAFSKVLAGVSASAGALTGVLLAALVVWKGTVTILDSMAVSAESLGKAFPHVSEAFRKTAVDIKNSGWADIGAFIADPFATSGTRAEEFTATGNALLEQGRALGLTYDQANKILEANSSLLNYNRASQEGFTEAVTRSLESIDAQSEALAKGDITMEGFVSHLMQAGLTSDQAWEIASNALDKFGKDVTQTGKVVKQFAGMTDDELKEFRASTKEAFAVSGNTIEGFKAKFEGSVRSFMRGLDQMRRRAKETLDDLREFNKIDLGEGVKKFLLEQGPEAIDRFVDANKQGRAKIVDDIRVILKAQKDTGAEIDTATGKTNNLTQAVGRLGQKRANPTVTFEYKTSGGEALEQFLNISGSKT